MLATDATHTSQHLEDWHQTERMRHVPNGDWLCRKLDGDVRPRAEKLGAVFTSLPHGDPRRPALEKEMQTLCRSLDRLADVARRPRGASHPPSEVSQRLTWSLNHAYANLQSLDQATFGRRLPFQTFERSNGEPLYAAMLCVIQRLQNLQELARAVDPRIDERLYEGLVVLQTPLRTDPIA